MRTRCAPLGRAFSLVWLDAKHGRSLLPYAAKTPLQRVKIHPRGTLVRVKTHGRANRFTAPLRTSETQGVLRYTPDCGWTPHTEPICPSTKPRTGCGAAPPKPDRFAWANLCLRDALHKSQSCLPIGFGSPRVLRRGLRMSLLNAMPPLRGLVCWNKLTV